MLSPQNIVEVKQLQDELKACRIKWAPYTNYHLTLKFLGDTPSYYINSIKIILEEIAHKHSAFCMGISGLGYFGNQKPRIIWAGIETEKKLIDIQRSVENKLQQLGFEKENKPFRPHLTLGRIKHVSDFEQFKDILHTRSSNLSQSIKVSELILFESRLNQNRAEYVSLEKIPL